MSWVYRSRSQKLTLTGAYRLTVRHYGPSCFIKLWWRWMTTVTLMIWRRRNPVTTQSHRQASRRHYCVSAAHISLSRQNDARLTTVQQLKSRGNLVLAGHATCGLIKSHTSRISEGVRSNAAAHAAYGTMFATTVHMASTPLAIFGELVTNCHILSSTTSQVCERRCQS